MVAPGQTTQSYASRVLGSIPKPPDPKKAWDLKSHNDYTTWSLPINAGIKLIAGEKFVESDRPTIDDFDCSKLSHAETITLINAARLHDQENSAAVYNYVLGNLAPDVTKAKHIQKHFEKNSDGRGLMRWIRSLVSDSAESAQTKLTEQFNDMQLPADANNATFEKFLTEAGDVFERIEVNEYLPVTSKIKAVLKKIPASWRAHTEVRALMTLNMVSPPWKSYDDFVEKVVEHVKNAVPDSSTSQQGAFVFQRQDGGTGKKWVNNCKTCDVMWCDAEGNIAKCMGMNDMELPRGVRPRGQKFYKRYRAHQKKFKLKTMKGVRVPPPDDDGNKGGGSGTGKSSTPVVRDGTPGEPVSDESEDSEEFSDAFWNAITAGDSASTEAVTMVHAVFDTDEPAPSPQVGVDQAAPTPSTAAPKELTSSSDSAGSFQDGQLLNVKEVDIAALVKLSRDLQEERKEKRASVEANPAAASMLEQAQRMSEENHAAILASREDLAAREARLSLREQAIDVRLAKAEAHLQQAGQAAKSASSLQARLAQLRDRFSIVRKLTGAEKGSSMLRNIVASCAIATACYNPAVVKQAAKLLKEVVQTLCLAIAKYGPRVARAMYAKLHAKFVMPMMSMAAIFTTLSLTNAASAMNSVRVAMPIMRSTDEHAVDDIVASAFTDGDRHVAMPVGVGDAFSDASLHDSGATDLLTNSLRGLKGKLWKIDAQSFKTANGSVTNDTLGIFKRRLYGSNGEQIDIEETMFYDPSLPFDIIGKPAGKRCWGMRYIDATDTEPPKLYFANFDKTLTLAVSDNGLEWLARRPPPPQAIAMLSSLAASLYNTSMGRLGQYLERFLTSTPADVTTELQLPPERVALMSAGGVGMGKPSLTSKQKAMLSHAVLRHTSLKRMALARKYVTGMLSIDEKGVKEFACEGCDLCNAYKLKLLTPKATPRDPAADADEEELVMYYDDFGPVATPALGTGYTYGAVFVIPSKCFVHVDGSKDLLAETKVAMLAKVKLMIETHSKFKVKVVRLDPHPSHRSKQLYDWFVRAMVDRQLTPPGQQEYNEAERWMYPLFINSIIAMRHAGAPRAAWHSAMIGQADVENVLPSRLAEDDPLPGYTRLFGFKPDISDMEIFYARGRFPKDQKALDGKFDERARAGFWLHRALPWVYAGKTGCCVYWDGLVLRDCAKKWIVYNHRFLDLTAHNNPHLPAFPSDAEPMPAALPEADKTDAQLVVDIAWARNPDLTTSTQPQMYTDSNAELWQIIAPNIAEVESLVRAAATLDESLVNDGGEVDGSHMASRHGWPLRRRMEGDCRWAALAEAVLIMQKKLPSAAEPSSSEEPPLSITRPRRDAVQPERYAFVLAPATGKYERRPSVANLAHLDECTTTMLKAVYPATFLLTRAPSDQPYAINVMAGSYFNPKGTTKMLRDDGYGVVNVDGDALVGGGAAANITTDQVYSDLAGMCRSGHARVLLVQQYCSPTSKARWRAGGPPPLYSQEYPDGIPDLPPQHQRELRINELVSWRVCQLMRLVFARGGYFMAETPSSSGDVTSEVTYDPGCPQHLSLFETRHYKSLAADTGSSVVHISMCRFYGTESEAEAPADPTGDYDDDGELMPIWVRHGGDFTPATGPQKHTDVLVSPNWTQLISALQDKLCVHPVGTHPKPPPARDENGNWATKAMQVWPPAFCRLVANAVTKVLEPGGISLDMGCASLRVAAAIEAHHYDRNQLEHELLNRGMFALVTQSSSSVPIPSEQLDETSSWKVPQTDSELERCPQRSFWRSCDDTERQVQLNNKTIVEMDFDTFLTTYGKSKKLWNTKMVRTIKESATTGAKLGRSRLCEIGTGHVKGVDYRFCATPTPAFCTVLMIISGATIADERDFQFDVTQFFQTIDRNSPDGDHFLNPPKHMRRNSDNRRVVWKSLKWLQGSRGASYEARAEFILHIQKLGVYATVEDPSLFVWERNGKYLRFALHGDDGIGSADNDEMVDEFVAHMRQRWPDLKFGGWGDILGFACVRDRSQRRTEISAPKHIQRLEQFVSGDVRLTPSAPYTETFNNLIKDLEPPEEETAVEDTPEQAAQRRDNVVWLEAAVGHLQFISKIRFDIEFQTNTLSAHTHKGEAAAVQAAKLVIFYLLNTKELAWTAQGDTAVGKEALTMQTPLPQNYIFEVADPKPYYPFAVSDGALGLRGSRFAVSVFFGGVAVICRAGRQHSIARDGYQSEAFACTSAASSAILVRNLAHAMGYPQLLYAPAITDNSSTVDVATGDAAMRRSLFIRRRIFALLQASIEGETRAISVAGKNNPMDPLTKVVPKAAWLASRKFLLNV